MEKIFLGYIYKITNQINGKVYIGQTSKIDPTKRWNEHRHAVIDPDQKERPLYRAMRKYGIDNFKFEVIETVYEEDHTTLNQREQYYIKKYNSFLYSDDSNGYNLTLGGDGHALIDEQEQLEIIKLYQEKQNIQDVRLLTGRDSSVITNILRTHNIKVLTEQEVNANKLGVHIAVYDSHGLIAIYPSQADLGRHCKPNCPRNSICCYCDGEGAYKYFRGYRLERTKLAPFNNDQILTYGDLFVSVVSAYNPTTKEKVASFKSLRDAGRFVGLSETQILRLDKLKKAVKEETVWKGYIWKKDN